MLEYKANCINESLPGAMLNMVVYSQFYEVNPFAKNFYNFFCVCFAVSAAWREN